MPMKPPMLASFYSSQVLAVGASSGKFTNAMAQGVQYFFTCESDCWVKVTAAGGSAAADTPDNFFVKAGMTIPLCNMEDSGTTNSFVHAIRQAADGDATLVGFAMRVYPSN